MAFTGLSHNLAVSSCPVRTRLIKMPSSGGPVAHLERGGGGRVWRHVWRHAAAPGLGVLQRETDFHMEY